MNRKDWLELFCIICLMISCVCWSMHIVTDIKLNQDSECEHEFTTTINTPLSAALYTTNNIWIPTFITKCVKCGKVGDYE